MDFKVDIPELSIKSAYVKSHNSLLKKNLRDKNNAD